MPIPFPVSRITPEEDPTERALHAVIAAVGDLAVAVADVTTADRAKQIRRRIGAAIAVLMDAENQALRKMDALD